MTEIPGVVRFLCTDRQTHSSRELAVLLRTSTLDEELELLDDFGPEVAADVAESLALARVDPSRRRGGHSPGDFPDGPTAVHTEGVNWRFLCPTCHRDVRLTNPAAVHLVDTLLANGLTTVDVSALPAKFS